MHYRLMLILPFIFLGCVTAEQRPDGTATLAAELLAKDGGFTVDATGRSLSGSGLFAVSPYPERSRKFAKLPSAQEIARYSEANKDLLSKPQRNLGGWCEGNQNTPPCYLDVSVTLTSEAFAVLLGRNCNQQSIAQLGVEVRFINTGGDGKPIFGDELRRCHQSIEESLL